MHHHLRFIPEIFWVKGDTNNAIKFRTDAEAAYRNAGNNIKADEMVAWLNFEALSSAKAIEQKKVVPELKIESESEENLRRSQLATTQLSQAVMTPIWRQIESCSNHAQNRKICH